MDKCLHDLVENYAEITPNLHGKTRHRRRAKLAAAVSAAPSFGRCGQFWAAGVSRFAAQYWRVIFNQIVQHLSINSIVRGVCRVFLGFTEAALMVSFTPISHWTATCAMRTACVRRGALRAPLCIRGAVMARFAGQRKIGVKVPMKAASVDRKHT